MSGGTRFKRRCLICDKPLHFFEIVELRGRDRALCLDSTDCERIAEGMGI